MVPGMTTITAAWSLIFSLFWTVAGAVVYPPPAMIERYFFVESGVTHVFEVWQPFAADFHLLVERSEIGNGIRAVRRVPPVFRLFRRNIDDTPAFELIVGVIKATSLGPRRRVFVFRPQGAQIKPVWLSSRLSYVLQDFTMSDTDRTSLLHTRETRYGEVWRGTYIWDTFGFRPIAMKEEVQ